MPTSRLPVEVELVYEVMPCQALRVAQEPGAQPHACTYFKKWGRYHSFDYVEDGPPPDSGVPLDIAYAGRAALLPELLSGCRKAPILAVGINPNLPGWWEATRGSLNPLFDEYRQYAHYFRYRATAKLEVPPELYKQLGGGPNDTPFSDFELQLSPDADGKRHVRAQLQAQKMYLGYQDLLEGLAARAQWSQHKLQVGEDLSYGNMVACPSAKWTTKPLPGSPPVPPMKPKELEGIVGECFRSRRYFLRQLFQSLPPVLLVFSQSTARAFITELADRFSVGEPKPDEPIEGLSKRVIRLHYGELADNRELDARVIFAPHITGNPQEFQSARNLVIEQLFQEVQNKRLELNPSTGHLRRPQGSCSYCVTLEIGRCDYSSEVVPLSRLSGGLSSSSAQAEADKQTQAALLGDLGRTPRDSTAWDDAAQLSGSSSGTATATSLLAQPGQPGLSADQGPSRIALRGRIVTMEDPGRILPDGLLLIEGSRIVGVVAAGQPLPPAFAKIEPTATDSTLYPGLIDLHNHFAYNALPLWPVKKRFRNREQWPKLETYKREVSRPIKLLAKYSGTARALVRYVETKALLGGVTTGQGIRTQVNGGSKLFAGAIRNVETPGSSNLPAAATLVPNLQPQKVEDFRRGLKNNQAYFYHLSEGVDEAAHRHFELLRNHQLLAQSLVGIHSLALNPEDLLALSAVGAKIVWSPFSNLLLYGQTIDLKALAKSRVKFSIGCDWSPTGSKNLLQELKVARFESARQGQVFSDEELVRGVTCNAAQVAAWDNAVGVLRPTAFADVLAIRGTTGDPYAQLISAVESDIVLVMIGGIAHVGSAALLRHLHGPQVQLEEVRVGQRTTALFLPKAGTDLDAVSFDEARTTLAAAMSDLHQLARDLKSGSELAADGTPLPQPFSVDLDLEDDSDVAFDRALATGFQPGTGLSVDGDLDNILAPAIWLDEPWVGADDYFSRVDAQANISAELKLMLRGAYRG